MFQGLCLFCFISHSNKTVFGKNDIKTGRLVNVTSRKCSRYCCLFLPSPSGIKSCAERLGY